MHTIGEIISTYRKQKGLSQTQLSSMLKHEGFDITNKGISKWENGQTEPTAAAFLSVCRLLNISDPLSEYFANNPNNPFNGLNESGKQKALEFIDILHATNMYESENNKIISIRRLIDIYENAVSAGPGNFLVDGPKETIDIDEKLIPDNTSFGVRICGNSMEPEFFSGEIAWVCKQNTLDNGEIGIFSLNGEAYIKKILSDKSGTYLISLNKDYSPIRVMENDRFYILGKVIGKADDKLINDSEG